jgi:ParB family chromosome partitioning protein
MPVSNTIPLHLLDDPEIAMRSEIDDTYIAELASDIAKNGLINPVAVKKVGDRYVIIAGHCRTIAKRKLGHNDIEVRDYTGESIDTETIKCRENLGRRDVSDADIAEYLSDVQAKHHYTIDKLQEITGQSEDWISKRLSLFDGDRDVFDALRKGEIKLGHALALNKFPELFRAQYLQITINSTPPVRLVEDWLRQCRMHVATAGQSPAEQAAPSADTPPPGVVIDACQICNSSELVWTMQFVRIHQHCLKMILDAIQQQEKGA